MITSQLPAPSVTKPMKLYFPALTGIRALAAWMVFFYHFNHFPVNSIAWRIAEQGAMGVVIFFVLSGFLIALRYGENLLLSRAWMMNYARNRVARIYPMFFLLTCLTFLIIQFNTHYDITGLWVNYLFKDKLLVFGLNVTFLRGFFDQFKFTGVAPGWTLTLEECFYFSAPFILLGIKTKPARLLIYGGAIIALGCILVALPAPLHPYGFFDTYAFMLSLTFPGHCLTFFSGIYLAVLLRRGNLPVFRRPIFTLLGLSWLGSYIGLSAMLSTAEKQTEVILFIRIFLSNVTLAPGVCILLYGLIQEKSILCTLLSSPLFDLLGKSSYAFYLIHLGILSQFLTLHITQHLIVQFIIINIIAIILYKYVENPLHKLFIAKNKQLA